jgi:peroxiredoxin
MPRLAALLLIVACVACAAARSSVADVAVEDLDGRHTTLATLRGHPALLYLFTTGCDICLADMAKLRTLDERYRDRHARIVALALDPDGARIVRPYAEGMALPFPIVVAGNELRIGSSALGPVTAVPRVVVVDASGRVREDLNGLISYDTMAAALERALDASPH